MDKFTRLLFVNYDCVSKKQQNECIDYIKNMQEGNNQDIYTCPEKKNLVRLKKAFIKKVSKKNKQEEKTTIACVLLNTFETKNDYFYVDYGDDKFKHNNYYECYSFTENELTKLVEGKAIHESTKDSLINMKKKVNDICPDKNIVCFGHNWKISVADQQELPF